MGFAGLSFLWADGGKAFDSTKAPPYRVRYGGGYRCGVKFRHSYYWRAVIAELLAPLDQPFALL